MRILLDTNVLLSAAWRDRLPEKIVLYVATSSDIQWITTPAITAEYVDVLRRPKFALGALVLEQWNDLVQMRTVSVTAPPLPVTASRDPKDTKFLAAAIATNADYLVTGDSDLLLAKDAVSTRILTVAEFAAVFSIS